jgi:ribonuclease E
VLDDDKNTPTTESAPAARTRRRAAGRPAGPPAAVSTDIFAAPATDAAPAADTAAAAAAGEVKVVKKAPARRSTRKAAPPAPAAEPADETPAASDVEASEQDAPTTPRKRPARKRPAKKAATAPEQSTDETPAEDAAEAAAETPADAGTSGEAAGDDEPAAEKAPAKRPARKRAPRAARPADDVSPVAVAFQAPPPVAAPPVDAADDDEETTDAPAEEREDERDEAESGEGSGGAGKRRRRSRGGRRRNKGDDAKDGQARDDAPEADASDEPGDDADGDGQDGEGSGGGTRRRRRRARAGDRTAASPDDPENTVVRVREGRNPEDEITGVTGSTRLEAKKQRRREGREAGRRRAPIVSEAEFLARRESVDRQMVVRQHVGTGHGGESDQYTQIAVLEDSVLVEHYVARESQTSLIGNVYLGKVQNVLPSMEAAFVDIGAGRNAVIYAGEVDWSGVQNGKARKIEEALSPGQQILVQVTKDPIGQKGARLTSQISLPGRFLVYVPGGHSNGISRKLPDTERSRLKSLLKEVLPEDAGVIVRTAAEGATEEQLTRDVSALTARWEDIKAKAGLDEESGPKAKGPQLLYAEPDLVIKVVRDLFNEDFASLIVEGSDAWDNISGYISHVAPDLAERLQEWSPADHDGRDSFDVLRVDEQIQKALQRKVWLPSGGSLVIDRTEAMTVVDVNTGKFTGSGGNLEETVTKNNLEAAEEIVRQLRLRDIGGIVVIDFIDMVLESNRDLVLRRLVECLGRDRTRHQVAEVTSLGLVQMTRKRIGTGLLESFSTECEHCDGRGVVITAEPVEPKKEEPRGRSRRGRGGNGGGNGGGNNGGNNGSNGGGNNGGGNGDSGKGDSGRGNDQGGGNGRGGRRGGQRSGTSAGDDGPADAATPTVTDVPKDADASQESAPVAAPADEQDAVTSEPQPAATSEEALAESPAPAVDAVLEPTPGVQEATDEDVVPEVDSEVAPSAPQPVQDVLPAPEAEQADDQTPALTEEGEGP